MENSPAYIPDSLLAALNEYFPNTSSRVVREKPAGSPNAASTSDDGLQDTIEAMFERVWFGEDAKEKYLFVSMRTSDGHAFTIRVPERNLGPSEPYISNGGDFDVEHLIADALLTWIDETIFRYTATYLDGRSLAEL
jgi:hypothetical protein